jgi:hypothetical protein
MGAVMAKIVCEVDENGNPVRMKVEVCEKGNLDFVRRRFSNRWLTEKDIQALKRVQRETAE